jgi:hypothetical protein
MESSEEHGGLVVGGEHFAQPGKKVGRSIFDLFQRFERFLDMQD